jgi:hypothetical protein
VLVHAAEQLVGWRIIATPTALDAVKWPKGSRVVRISPDDVFLVGAAEPKVSGDTHAIVTPEHGFSGVELSAAQVASIAEQHIEWPLPAARPSMAQGQIAGVPAKLLFNADGSALLLVACAASRELLGRLGLAS